MIKENPCTKCCSYNENNICECNELFAYKHYQQGKADAIENMYVSIKISIENVENGADINEEFEWLHQFDEQLKEKKSEMETY